MIVVLVMLKLVGKATDEADGIAAMLSQLPHKMGLAPKTLNSRKLLRKSRGTGVDRVELCKSTS